MIPVSFEQRFKGLSEQLHAYSHRLGSTRCGLLVQAVGAPSIANSPLRAALRDPDFAPIPIKLSPLPESVWPWLLHLDIGRANGAHLAAVAMEAAWRGVQAKSLQAGEPGAVCAWIFHDGNPARLAHHIASHALQRQWMGRRRRKWVRFYDPMVMDLYWSLLSPEQREHLIGPATAWVSLDRRAQLVVRSRGQVERKQRHPLAPEQWRRLQYAGAINQAWIKALKHGLALDEVGFLGSFGAMDVLDAYALRETADVDLFAWHCLHYGADFPHVPEVRKILARVNAEEGYCHLAQSLADPAWTRTGNGSGRLPPLQNLPEVTTHG